MKLSKLGMVAAVVGCLMTTAASMAHADELSDIRQAGTIKIGIDLGIPPYGMMNDNMQPAGVDVEIARKLAADLGVKLDIVTSTGASRIPNLQTHKADLVISSLSVTADRAKVIDFSIPYMPIQTIIFAPKDMKITTFSDLLGKKVAVTRGTSQDAAIMSKVPTLNLIRYEDDATLITAAVTGQADVIGGTPAHLVTVKQKAPGRHMEVKLVLQTFPAAIGVSKGQPELLAWVNQWVKTNLNNGSLNAIYKKYFDADLPPEILAGGK